MIGENLHSLKRGTLLFSFKSKFSFSFDNFSLPHLKTAKPCSNDLKLSTMIEGLKKKRLKNENQKFLAGLNEEFCRLVQLILWQHIVVNPDENIFHLVGCYLGVQKDTQFWLIERWNKDSFSSSIKCMTISSVLTICCQEMIQTSLQNSFL